MNEETKLLVKEAFFFKPLPFIKRIVFICVPHRGSKVADWGIGRLGSSLIRLRGNILKTGGTLLASVAETENRILLRQLKKPTSIGGLSPNDPVLHTLCGIPFEPGVRYHSIIANVHGSDLPGGTDKVVTYESSHLEGAESEKIVHSDHNAHKHAEAIAEVYRILRHHLNSLG